MQDSSNLAASLCTRPVARLIVRPFSRSAVWLSARSLDHSIGRSGSAACFQRPCLAMASTFRCHNASSWLSLRADPPQCNELVFKGKKTQTELREGWEGGRAGGEGFREFLCSEYDYLGFFWLDVAEDLQESIRDRRPQGFWMAGGGMLDPFKRFEVSLSGNQFIWSGDQGIASLFGGWDSAQPLFGSRSKQCWRSLFCYFILFSSLGTSSSFLSLRFRSSTPH